MTTPIPCPFCGTTPERFLVRNGIHSVTEVIACKKGCKPNWNSVVLHIKSDWVYGWKDLAEAWNTMEVYEENGLKKVRFDAYHPNVRPLQIDGPFCEWSSLLSTTKTMTKYM